MTYPTHWHTFYGDMTAQSARRILPPLLDLFAVRSLVEVGCGIGHMSRTALDHGVDDLLALDGAWTNRADLLIDEARFRDVDLAQPLELGRRFDLAVCLEVAEHVPAASARILVKSLVEASDVVMFGAAIPLQGGAGHINEQWQSYWRDLFAEHGYQAFDLVRPRHWNDRGIHYWYRQNTLVYVCGSNANAVSRAREAGAGQPIPLFDVVHPEKYEHMASYEGIALKRLLRRLPGRLASEVRSRLWNGR